VRLDRQDRPVRLDHKDRLVPQGQQEMLEMLDLKVLKVQLVSQAHLEMLVNQDQLVLRESGAIME
jgi:hypothetical protein